MRKMIDITASATQDEIEMLLRAKRLPISYDADLPELTAEQLAKFQRISVANSQARRKQTVCLRLTPEALRTAKSLGKGYTSVLSRIVENALKDTTMIEQYL